MRSCNVRADFGRKREALLQVGLENWSPEHLVHGPGTHMVFQLLTLRNGRGSLVCDFDCLENQKKEKDFGGGPKFFMPKVFMCFICASNRGKKAPKQEKLLNVGSICPFFLATPFFSCLGTQARNHCFVDAYDLVASKAS